MGLASNQTGPGSSLYQEAPGHDLVGTAFIPGNDLDFVNDRNTPRESSSYMPDSDLQRNIKGSISPPTLVMAGAPLTARDEERRQWYVDTLQHAGYQVVSAADVSPTPAESAGGLPSMIIAHLFEPIADGIALCRKLRTAAATRDLPVIVVTRLDDPYTREQIVRSGCVEHLDGAAEPCAACSGRFGG